jgi:hypothetical protein
MLLFVLAISVLLSLIPGHFSVDSSTLKKKVLFGYQGWFQTPSGTDQWVHWSGGVKPAASTVSFDLYPDTSDFESIPQAVDFSTDLHYRDNADAPMGLISSLHAIPVHFSWMQQYNIDGVFVQSFVSQLSTGRNYRDQILLKAISEAEKNERVISIMYDISGAQSTWYNDILNDWDYLVQDMNVTSSPSWQRHDGKPVLAVWGIGFNDNGIGAVLTPTDAQYLVDTLKSKGAYFVGGVPTWWRDGNGDSLPGYDNVYAAMDSISPWMVGRFDSKSFHDVFMHGPYPDSALCGNRSQGYAPVVWPGFSWFNLQNNYYGGAAIYNQIPRSSGQFFTTQFEAYVQHLQYEPLFIYGAMFDEFDEATAIAKAAANQEKTPVEGTFLHLSVDGQELPSDFYLSLAGQYTTMYQDIDSSLFTSRTHDFLETNHDFDLQIAKSNAFNLSIQQIAHKCAKSNKIRNVEF